MIKKINKDSLNKMIREELRRIVTEGDEYRERETATLRDIAKEVGISHVAAQKIVDRALEKAALVFLGDQLEELMEQLDNGEITQDKYDARVLAITPVEQRAKEIIKTPEFVDYFKSTYLGQQ